MRLQPIISGLVIGGAGFAIQYYSIFENQYYSYGAMGIGALLILVGLFMKKKLV